MNNRIICTHWETFVSFFRTALIKIQFFFHRTVVSFETHTVHTFTNKSIIFALIICQLWWCYFQCAAAPHLNCSLDSLSQHAAISVCALVNYYIWAQKTGRRHWDAFFLWISKNVGKMHDYSVMYINVVRFGFLLVWERKKLRNVRAV